MRPCAGIALFNAEGQVWIGRRSPKWASTPQSYLTGHMWQLPQGGIFEGEQPADAAVRELREETGVSSVSLLAEIPGWLSYELPSDLMGIALKGRYGGQRLRWFAMRFEGDDAEIDIDTRRLEVGVRRLAVGRPRRAAGAGAAVQALGLRDRGVRVRAVRPLTGTGVISDRQVA